jgi:hypothetical protein
MQIVNKKFIKKGGSNFPPFMIRAVVFLITTAVRCSDI